jgi:hypothetical protein
MNISIIKKEKEMKKKNIPVARDVLRLEHLLLLLLFPPLPFQRVGGEGLGVDGAVVVAPVIAVIVVAKINISVIKKNRKQKKIPVAGDVLRLEMLLLLFLPSPFRSIGSVGVDDSVVVMPVIAVVQVVVVVEVVAVNVIAKTKK